MSCMMLIEGYVPHEGRQIGSREAAIAHRRPLSTLLGNRALLKGFIIAFLVLYPEIWKRDVHF